MNFILLSLQSLLSMLGVQQAGRNEFCIQGVQTLQNLASRLEARIYYYQDPILYSPKLGIATLFPHFNKNKFLYN